MSSDMGPRYEMQRKWHRVERKHHWQTACKEKTLSTISAVCIEHLVFTKRVDEVGSKFEPRGEIGLEQRRWYYKIGARTYMYKRKIGKTRVKRDSARGWRDHMLVEYIHTYIYSSRVLCPLSFSLLPLEPPLLFHSLLRPLPRIPLLDVVVPLFSCFSLRTLLLVPYRIGLSTMLL